MSPSRSRRVVHGLFVLGVVAKGLDGLLEVVGGLGLLALGPDRLPALVRLLTRRELAEDPHDFIATHLLQAARHLSAGTVTFASVFLLSHGVIKVGLVAGLLLRRHWAYPVAIVAFVLFLLYQLVRYLQTRSPALLALSVSDVLVIALTWVEYRRLRAEGAFS
jgi:uncharacterized membrane protein